MTVKILVFQQNQSGESKIAGIRKYGGDQFDISTFDIDMDLPPIIDDTHEFLPQHIEADLVLDFFKHPDLSHDLARLCADQQIPVVASGKKHSGSCVFIPPT
jgi:hypothetical protein